MVVGECLKNTKTYINGYNFVNFYFPFKSSKSLSHVAPLRNYFLKEENYKHIKRPPGDQAFLLVQRFGELIRKLWNLCNFKAHVSPHEMLQAVVLTSKKRFQITEQGTFSTIYLL